MADRLTAVARTRSAIRAAKEGENGDARSLLVEALQADREYAPAWLWFAAVTNEPEEQLFCLQEAQRLKPDAQTEAAIAKLRDVEAEPPEELRNFTDPELPDLVDDDFKAEAAAARRKRQLITLGIVLGALLVVAGLIAWVRADHRPTVYLAVTGGSAATPGPATGAEIKAAAEWAAAKFTASDRLPGYRVETVYFPDDNDPVKAKAVAQQIVDDGRFVGVIGHQNSACSEAAGPIYAGAKLPAITPSATADSVTEGNAWYFRTVFDNTTQGIGASDYVKGLLGGGSTATISIDNSYGRTLAAGYKQAYSADGGQVLAEAVVPLTDATTAANGAIEAAVKQVIDAAPTGPILLVAPRTVGVKVVQQLRAGGFTNLVMGSDSLATQKFYSDLTNGSRGIPAEDLDSVFTASPLVVEGLSGEAVSFYEAFTLQEGYEPSWEAGLTYDALDVFAEAIIRSGGKVTDLADTRDAIREELTRTRSKDVAFKAITHPIYFDSNGSAVRPVAWQVAEPKSGGGVNIDASYYQLATYSPEAGVSLEKELAEGNAVQQGNRVYTVQRIVNVGANINQITDLDTAGQTFTTSMFIYFIYPGDDQATDIKFANSVGDIKLGKPVRTSKFEDQTYALYEVSGKFKSQMDFRNFPFDKQSLVVEFGNRTLPTSRIAYTVDPDLLATPQATRLESGVDAGSTIDYIPNWRASSVLFYPKSIGNTSTLGDPNVNAGPGGVTYSQFVTETDISRDVAKFLVKNVLPLALLVLVTFLGLWLPLSDGGRVSFAVTGILTGAVMLNSVTNSLPNVQYTVAMEWAYYAFILLSGTLLLFTLVGRHLENSRRLASVRKLNSFVKIYFVVYVACVVGAYVLKFGLN